MWDTYLVESRKADIRRVCFGLSSEFLVDAVNEYNRINNIMKPTVSIGTVPRDKLVNLVYRMIFVTRVMNAEGTVFWIVENGRYFINLND